MNVEQQIRIILSRRPNVKDEEFIECCREYDVLDIDQIRDEKEFLIKYQAMSRKPMSSLAKARNQIVKLEATIEDMGDVGLTIDEINRLKNLLGQAKEILGVPLLQNLLMNTKGSPTSLSYGEIQALVRLKLLYMICYPGRSSNYNNRTTLRELGETIIDKLLPKKVDRLIDQQMTILEMVVEDSYPGK